MTSRARDLAMAAYAQYERDRQKGQRDAAAQHRRYLEERLAVGQALIEASELSEWFPGVEWAIVDWYSDGTFVIAPEPERDFEIAVREKADPSRYTAIYVGKRAIDKDTSYPYWSGGEVHSLAEVGEYLQARRDQAVADGGFPA